MKIFLYFVLIIAFLVFYQTNPLVAAIFIILFIGIVIFFKMRKRGIGLGGLFLSGQNDRFEKRFDDLMLLILLDHLQGPHVDLNHKHSKNPSKNNDLGSSKPNNDVLDLLKEGK